eukprot:tig00021493_g21890.t1
MFVASVPSTAAGQRAPVHANIRARPAAPELRSSKFFGSGPVAATKPAQRRADQSNVVFCAAVPASEIGTVFVAGATGETGRLIVKLPPGGASSAQRALEAELLERGVKVRAGVRNPEEAKGVVPEGAEVLRADVKDAKMLPGCIGDAKVVVCASGVNYRKGETKNPLGPFSVDYVGTKNLVEAAKAAGVKHFVLVTSLCVSKLLHPLNLFYLILFWKKQAEEHLRGSGVTYTIVRPGGLSNDPVEGEVVASGADTLFKGRINRGRVAKVAADAVFETESYNKVVEIVQEAGAPAKSPAELFAAL